MSENCRIMKGVAVTGSCCCTCSKPSSQSAVTCSWTDLHLLCPTGPLKSDKNILKYLLQQKKCCCTCCSKPSSQSAVTCSWTVDLHLCRHNCAQLVLKTFKYLLQQKNSRPYSLQICQCQKVHCAHVDHQKPLTK